MKKNWFLYTICCLFGLLAVSCQEDDEMGNGRSTGYLRLQIATNTSMATKAEEVYNPKQLAVKVVNSEGESVWNTDDWTTLGESQNIKLPVGTYTVQASSAGFDGKTSAYDKPYYAGSASDVVVTKDGETTAKVVCTLANVKVTVNFADDFKTAFKTAAVTVGGLKETADPLSFTMGGNEGVGYFPVTDIYAKIAVVNQSDVANNQTDTITGVQARDHYIFNYTIAATGSGSITIDVDASTKTYTYHFAVPTTAQTTVTANAWSTFAYLEATVPGQGGASEISKMKFQYKQASEGDEAWKDSEEAITYDEASKVYKTTLKGLTATTEYQCRLVYDDNSSSPIPFTTEGQTQLANMSLDNWYTLESGTILKKTTYYPCTQTEYSNNTRIWDSGNDGSNTLGTVNPTSPETTDVVKGQAAVLESKEAANQFAAGSLFTGRFGGATLSPLGATLDFGTPYTARPTKLKGSYKYIPQNVTNVNTSRVPQVVKGQRDSCSIYVALATWETAFKVSTGDDKFVDFSSEDIIAYGELSKAEMCPAKDMEEYAEFTIDLKYRDLTKKPTYILVVCSSSKYGDYFVGGLGSKMWVDELSFEFGEPTIDPAYIK